MFCLADEEVDDLADHLRLSRRRSSSKQKDDRTMHMFGRTSDSQKQEVSQEQDSQLPTRLRLSTSGKEFSSGLHMSSRNVDQTTSYREAKDDDSTAALNIPSEQSLSPSKV